MRKYSVHPGSEKDMLELYGQLPPYATRSWKVIYEGELAAIAGVEFSPTNNIVFSDIKKGLKPAKLTVWRATLEIFNNIKNLNKPLVAVCDGTFMNSELFLKRLGFRYYNSNGNEDIYVFQ